MSRVLVVDDSAVDRRLVSGLLKSEGEGMEVETAENGREALERLRERHFDLVVTDLQMPELDGLGLVREIRDQGLHVPVILITAHGSEELAIEALEEGAASYVPKSQLADYLQDSVEQVLTLINADRSYERLSACQTRAEFTFLLENDTALIDPIVDLIQQIAFSMGLCDMTGKYRIGMAFQQALLNAMFHGNMEIQREQFDEAREALVSGSGQGVFEQRQKQAPYSERRVFVDARISKDQIQFVIRDEGPGFDVSRFHQNGAGGELKGGRGMRLMRMFMDDVHYNDVGNEVTMIKRRDKSLGMRTIKLD